jgi:hypothetical protein
MLQDMKKERQKTGASIKVPSNGHDAAVEVVNLMQRTFGTIKPIEIVDVFDNGDDLWSQFGTRAVSVMSDGVRTLRAIWKGAWNAAGGDTKIAAGKLREADHKKLVKLYLRKTWVPSKSLKTIGAILK